MTNEFSPPNPNVLMLEGLSDYHFVTQLLNQLELELDVEVSYKSGLSSVLASIYAEIAAPQRDVVGILLDADDDLASRWSEVADRLSDAGVSVPSSPEPQGTITDATEDRPRVGIWIMPDNRSPGELEDFVIDMIPDDDQIWPRSVNYIDGIPISEREFSEGKTDRAKLYAWLATRRQPPHIGAAIGAGDFDLKAERCETFVGWLRRLYGDGSVEMV